MAIKVKHEGSAASRIAAAQQGGAAKRAMEAAALIKPTPIQTLAPAHASAPGIGGVHAQLISAPGGGAHAQLIGGGGGIGAHARMGGAGGGRGGGAGSRVSTAGGGGGDLDYKVTGTSIFDRPDDESEWDPTNGGRWVRKWLPGEKEAEALGRVGAVKNWQEMEMLDFKHEKARDLAEQGSKLMTQREMNARKFLASLMNPSTAVKTGVPDAKELKNQMEEIKNNARAGAKDDTATGMQQDEPAPTDIQSVFNQIVSQSGSSDEVAMRIAGVYDNGGSIFGLQQEGGTSGSGGGVGPLKTQPENEYEQYLGGLTNMFLPNNK